MAKKEEKNGKKKKLNSMPAKAVTVDDPVTQTLAAKNLNVEKH